MRTFVAAKIHGVRVTDKSVEYHGSISIAGPLMQAAGIEPYEKVLVVNLTNGNRWETYAIPIGEGLFTLNGGGARMGEIGDRCVVMSFVQSEEFAGAHVVFCDGNNNIADRMLYEPYGEPGPF